MRVPASASPAAPRLAVVSDGRDAGDAADGAGVAPTPAPGVAPSLGVAPSPGVAAVPGVAGGRWAGARPAARTWSRRLRAWGRPGFGFLLVVAALAVLLAPAPVLRAVGGLALGAVAGRAVALRWRARAPRATAAASPASEERLRQLLDSAIDGVVELDAEGRIVRASDAFCALVRLPRREVAGRRWEEMAASAPSGSRPIADLLSTGRAELDVDGTTIHLEARASHLPTERPGTLLLVRDVTMARVSEQTIRNMVQFLQDRDEDRTRLLRTTDAALEAERNRIARDLHDGPIQGVTAASLSVNAARMMAEAGDAGSAGAILRDISATLADEAASLRRVMSDLRPPLLEERGLVPALRELCDRFERDHRMPVVLRAGPAVRAPAEVETLAYRIAQEALSNVGKHADATTVTVRVEAAGGTLSIEVTDDGRGFDPADARQFLRQGRVGLASMRERAELGGGTLAIRSRPGGGTTVGARLGFDVLSAVASLDPPAAAETVAETSPGSESAPAADAAPAQG